MAMKIPHLEKHLFFSDLHILMLFLIDILILSYQFQYLTFSYDPWTDYLKETTILFLGTIV